MTTFLFFPTQKILLRQVSTCLDVFYWIVIFKNVIFENVIFENVIFLQIGIIATVNSGGSIFLDNFGKFSIISKYKNNVLFKHESQQKFSFLSIVVAL